MGRQVVIWGSREYGVVKSTSSGSDFESVRGGGSGVVVE